MFQIIVSLALAALVAFAFSQIPGFPYAPAALLVSFGFWSLLVLVCAGFAVSWIVARLTRKPETPQVP